MSTLKSLREIKKMVADHGGRFLGHEYGKHIKARVDFGAGERLLVVPFSASCSRSDENMKRDLRRLAREAESAGIAGKA